MKVSKVILGCIALVGVIEVDVVSSMESLTSTQGISNNKTQGAEDALAEQKKIIDGLIPKLLNDENEEPRTYNENNVRSLFTVLLENKDARLCYYVEDKFVYHYLNDEFALECGLISTVQDARSIVPSPFSSSLSHLMDKFTYYFNSTKTRLLFFEQLDEEQEERV